MDEPIEAYCFHPKNEKSRSYRNTTINVDQRN